MQTTTPIPTDRLTSACQAFSEIVERLLSHFADLSSAKRDELLDASRVLNRINRETLDATPFVRGRLAEIIEATNHGIGGYLDSVARRGSDERPAGILARACDEARRLIAGFAVDHPVAAATARKAVDDAERGLSAAPPEQQEAAGRLLAAYTLQTWAVAMARVLTKRMPAVPGIH